MPMGHLLETNLGAENLRLLKKILLTGTCVPQRYPEIFNRFNTEDRVHLHVCLETFHMSMAGYKLAKMVAFSGIEDIIVLTVDGSPHCYQLHVIGQDIKRHWKPETHIEHWVIEHGELIQVDYQTISVGRHLHRVKNLLDESKKQKTRDVE